jgi:hypothetical protein
MRNSTARRARTRLMVGGSTVITALFAGACNLHQDLVSPETPGVIDPGAVIAAGPTGASGLRVGALGALKLQTGSGETLWQLGGLLTDEWASASTSAATNEIDKRTVSTNNPSVTAAYNNIQQTRGYFRDAIKAMKTYRPDYLGQLGELYLGLGFIEMQMAESFCNGIPLGTSESGAPVYGTPLTTDAVLALASVHFDSALMLLDSTRGPRSADTADFSVSRRVRPAASVAKARVLVDQGNFVTAATFANPVVTGYQYVLSFSTASGLNGNWNLNSSLLNYSVADSFSAAGVIANALPFASKKDVRVPSPAASVVGADGATPVFTQTEWANTGQIPLLSGIDARLIEAENRLNLLDIPGTMGFLNTLRTTQQTMGTFKPATQAALANPPNQAAAVALFFREKAFWTFGRGQRLGDLRRQVKQYLLPAASVGPSGNFLKGGTYGTDLNFPVPDAEKINPAFKGCIDRNP